MSQHAKDPVFLSLRTFLLYDRPGPEGQGHGGRGFTLICIFSSLGPFFLDDNQARIPFY